MTENETVQLEKFLPLKVALAGLLKFAFSVSNGIQILISDVSDPKIWAIFFLNKPIVQQFKKSCPPTRKRSRIALFDQLLPIAKVDETRPHILREPELAFGMSSPKNEFCVFGN
jgi:hypothetical protein